MNLRVKKFLATLVMSVMFTTSVLAASSSSFQVAVNRDYYSYGTGEATKNNDYSFGTITVNSGVVYSRSKLYAKIIGIQNPSCYTYVGEYTTNGTTTRPSYTTASMSMDYRSYDFEVTALLDRSSYVTQSTITGSFTP